MPSQASNAAALRADGHQMEVYLSAMVGAAVLVGSVSATPDAESALNIAYTTTSGSSANVRRGMRVIITTAGGDYKGSLSVRFAGTISSTNLPVREFSEGHVQVESGDVLRVYEHFALTDRLVSATEAFEPDYEPYADQNGDVKPVACSGGWWAGFVDSGQAYATIPLYGAESYTVDEDSSGSVTHLWTLPSGVTFAPGSADSDASPTVRAAAGYYVVQHDVTDASNGKTEVQYISLRVHDANDMPYELTLDSPISGDPARGFSFSVSLYANAGISALPDFSPVVLWTRERINGSVQSFGAKVSGRAHILCVGYLRRDVTTVDLSGSESVRFEVLSPLACLFELPGFSKVMDREASPDAWNEIEALTVRRGILQLARYYTNYPQLFDFVFEGFDDADYPALYLQKKSPAEQITELADGRGGRIASDQTGRLEVQQRLDLTPLASRSGVTTTFTLTDDDVIDVEIERDHVRPVETYRARGYTASTSAANSQPVFARWAASPGSGTSNPVTERLIVDDVADLYEQTAMRGAAEDRVFFDANGVQYPAPRVTVTLPGSYWGLFRCYREWVLLDFDETTNPRGVDLSLFRFMVVSAELELTGGTGRVRAVLQAETYAIGAVDDTPASESYLPDDPTVTYPTLTITPTRDGSGLPVVPTDLVGMNADGNLYAIAGANRLRVGGALSGTGYNLSLTGTPQDFTVRADSPLYINNSGVVNAHILTTTRYYPIGDVGGARTVGSPTTLEASTSLKAMQFERGNPDWGIIAYYVHGVGVRVVYTLDGGTTWSSPITVTAHWNTSVGINWNLPGLWLNPAGNGEAILTAHTNTAFGGSVTTGVFRTTDYGATWSAYGALAINPLTLLAQDIAAGFTDPSTFYHARTTVGGTYDGRLYRVRGATAVDISPSTGGDAYCPYPNHRAIAVADDDADTLVLCGIDDYSGANNYATFRTFNARAATPAWTQLTGTNIDRARRVYAVSRLSYYLIGTSGYLAHVGDGTTVAEGEVSGAGEFIGIAGV